MTRRHLEDLKMKRRCSGLRTFCLLSPHPPFVSSRSSLPFLSLLSFSRRSFRPFPSRPALSASLAPASPCLRPRGWQPSGVGSFGLRPSAAALWPQHNHGAGLWARAAPRSLSPGPSPSNPDAHPRARARTRTTQRLLCAPFRFRGVGERPSPARRGCVPRGVCSIGAVT